MQHKTFISLFLVVSCSIINGMDQAPTTNMSIQFFEDASFPRIIYEQLPSEVNGRIFDMACINIPDPFLNVIAKNINNLTLVCASFNTFINNSKRTLNLIKQLFYEFRSNSNEDIACVLQTKAAVQRLMLQKGFESMCGHGHFAHISPRDSVAIKKSNIDVNFTYGDDGDTQLIIAASGNFYNSTGKPLIVQWLIANGADINSTDSCGKSALIYALETEPDREKELIEYFLDHPQFSVNQKYDTIDGKYSLFGYLIRLVCLPAIKRKHRHELTLIQKFLEKGVDLEGLAVDNETPLDIAKRYKNNPLIDILQDAIVKKHAQQDCKM
jgi:hypothetical protein